MMPPRWTIYSKPGCSLCGRFMTELAALLGEQAAAEVEIIDITDDPALEARYGTKIPVLLANGEFVCCYVVGRERVTAQLYAQL